MGNTGERAANPLADIPRGATIDVVLDNVDFIIADGEWTSKNFTGASFSGGTLTVTGHPGARSCECGRIHPCTIRSVVATRSVFAVVGPVVLVHSDIRVDATESRVILRPSDLVRCVSMECSIRATSHFRLDGNVTELKLTAEDSTAEITGSFEQVRITASKSSVRGVQNAHAAFLNVAPCSRVGRLYVRDRVEFGESTGIPDVYVAKTCIIHNPPEWIPLATALAKE